MQRISEKLLSLCKVYMLLFIIIRKFFIILKVFVIHNAIFKLIILSLEFNLSNKILHCGVNFIISDLTIYCKFIVNLLKYAFY